MENTNVTLMNVRASYVHILKAYSPDPANQKPKFQMTILLPKTDTAGKAAVDAAIQAAARNGLNAKWNGVMPPVVPNPVHDGDGVKQNGEAYGPECKGHWVFTASSQADRPIEVVDQNLQKIIDPTQVYSGMYVNVAVNFFPYFYQGKKGIGCVLGPVQKAKDGEPLGGQAPSAKSVFHVIQPPQDGKETFIAINPLTGQPM